MAWKTGGIFLLATVSRLALGPHPASYPRGMGSLSPGVKQLAHEADHPYPSNVKVKNIWNYTSTPPVCLHDH